MNGQNHYDGIATLSGLLDEIVAEQVGADLYRLIEELRRLAKERRANLPGAEERLAARIRALTEPEIKVAVSALSAFFDVANIAEDCQRIHVLRTRERMTTPDPRAESVGDAVARLQRDGLTCEQIEDLLKRLHIELVFTAHPTEAKRRTTRRLLRTIRTDLQRLDTDNLLARERERLLDDMRSALTVLWQIDPMRPSRPTVMQEVERGLFFAEGLWEIVPNIYQDLRRALEAAFPNQPVSFSHFLRFGSWIGGDRDGHPFVTHEVTAQTLDVLRRTALERHLSTCRNLAHLLVMSDRQVAISDELRASVGAALAQWPEAQQRAESISEYELYRRWLKIMEFRLEATLSAGPGEAPHPAAYTSAAALERDIRLIADSIADHHGERIVAGYLQDWLDQLHTFGLHLAALDVRQDSRVHIEVLTEVFRRLGLADDYAALDEEQKQTLLAESLAQPATLDVNDLEGQPRETLSLFLLLARTLQTAGPDPLGGHVISMTHQPSDMLAVLWLWNWAWRSTGRDEPPAYLPIVPLFETIEDLDHGPDIFDSLLSNPTYAEYLTRAPDRSQIVMVGYSDSTKDGGYLSASWGLHRSQDRLAEVAERHGVRLIVFHGRGGALGRGGGPAARAILSLPPKSVGGAVRMTEQGEVLAERYDDPQIAYRHLEQVTWATMLVSGEEAVPPPAEWIAAMDELTARSFRRYRRLVEDPEFLPYFDQATPISEIERLPIASRPSRRRERRSLADLRAIPWTFAWTQCRQFIPAWFGLGTAVQTYVEEHGGDWSLLQQMYDEWPLFRATIDNADLALAKADISIAHRYAELAGDHAAGDHIWQIIAGEYQSSRASVLMITRQPDLLGGVAWLQRSIQERNPYVDPLNLIQIELIRRLRALPEDSTEEDAERLRELIRLTIQGVAAGLRTTG